MKLRIIISLLLLMPLAPAFSWEVHGAYGRTSQSESTFRIGMSKKWDNRWFDSNVGHLTGYWDAAYTFWEKGNLNTTNHSLSASPVLVYEFHTNGNIKPFIEAGIGIAFFNHTRVGDKRLGTSFNFEDRIGAGLRINEKHTIGLRALHYSNLGIKKPNQGIESFSLYYSYSF